jgi:hypothetical protein
MGDAQQKPTASEPSFGPATIHEESWSWLPMAIGGALVVVAVALIVVLTRSTGPNTSPRDPYIAKLQISDLNMATAENFAGGRVTYIQGRITNTGDRKLTAARVQVIFKNSLGEVTQNEVLPLMVLLPNTPYVDYGPLDRAPLAPGQARDFRLTLEHITQDWDGQKPDVKVVNVSAS